MVLFSFVLMLAGVLLMLMASTFAGYSVNSALRLNRSEADIKKAAGDAASAVLWAIVSVFCLVTSMVFLMHKFS